MSEHSTTRGFAILTVAGILSKVLSLLYVPLLKAVIGIEGYGIYAKTYDIFTFFYALTNIGMQTAIAKYIAELSTQGHERDGIRAFKIARTVLLLVGSFMSLLLIFSADFIAYRTSNPNIVYGLIALAPTIAITSVLCAYRGYFQGKNIMTPIAISTVVEQFINVSVSLIFAAFLMKYGISMGSAGGTVGTSVGALIAVYFLIYVYMKKKIEKNSIKNDVSKTRIRSKKILQKLFVYGLPITLSTGMQNLGSVIDMFNVNSRLLVAGFTTSEANILYGILGFYKTLIYVPLIIITALATAILPQITRAFVLKNKKSIRDNLIFTVRICFAVAIPSAIGLSMLSKEIYIVLFNTEQGHMLMTLGSFVVIFMALVQIQSTILQSINKFYFVLVSLGIGIALKILANYYFVAIPNINIYGAIIGGILCFVVPTIINQRKITKVVKVKVSLIKLSIKPLISSLIMAGVIYVLKMISSAVGIANSGRIVTCILLFVFIFIGMLAYGYIMACTGGIRKKEIESLSPKIVKLIPKFIKKKLR